MTMLSAIRVAGVMQDATVVVDGAINGETFLTYIEQFLAPSLRPGDVVVMDNRASHKIAGVREAIEAANCDLWYLPPYAGGRRILTPSRSCGARSRRGCGGCRLRPLTL